jgi:hypothetical protein
LEEQMQKNQLKVQHMDNQHPRIFAVDKSGFLSAHQQA